MDEHTKLKLKRYLQQWNLLEDEIRKENIKLSELYKRRQEIENKIEKYNNLFNEKKLTMIDNESNVKYNIFYTNKKKQISLKLLKNIINSYFQNMNFNKEDFYKYILKNRESIDKLVIISK